MLSYLIHEDNINMQASDVLTIVGEDYQRYPGQIKSIGKRAHEQKHHTSDAQMDALLTKIMDTLLKTCQNQEWHISQIDGYLKNVLWASSKEQQYC